MIEYLTKYGNVTALGTNGITWEYILWKNLYLIRKFIHLCHIFLTVSCLYLTKIGPKTVLATSIDFDKQSINKYYSIQFFLFTVYTFLASFQYLNYLNDILLFYRNLAKFNTK